MSNPIPEQQRLNMCTVYLTKSNGSLFFCYKSDEMKVWNLK